MSKDTTDLGIKYYLTSGIYHQKIYNEPFYVSVKSKGKMFNLNLIKASLSKDKIDISLIDDYRYFNQTKNGFIKIKESLNYPIEPKNLLILQIHLKEIINPFLINIQDSRNNIKLKMNELKELKNLSNKDDDIDLYYLYASPILKNISDENLNFINYHLEIKNITKLFENSKKKFNCIFECANEKTLINAIIKEPKILHISSHGSLDISSNYLLKLEDRCIDQDIPIERLKEHFEIISNNIRKIDLVFVSTCYSQQLGKLFLEYGVKNVIYIEGMTPVSDKASVIFNEKFYSEIIKGNSVEGAFSIAQKLLKYDRDNVLFSQNKCCCNHWHKNDCIFINNKQIHKQCHIKKCDCDFEEYNIHKKDCEFMKFLEDKNLFEKLFFQEKIDDFKTKVCCQCLKKENENKSIFPHGEVFKFKIETQEDNNIIFRFRKNGKLTKNNNCYIINDKYEFKRCSMIGRAKYIKEIYDIIDEERNVDNIHFIIIRGNYGIGKQYFAESVCIYLFERKKIKGFSMIEIKESKEELCNKVKELTYNGKNSDGKYIVVVKLSYNLEKPIEILNEILNENNIINPYFYYIILITHSDKIGYSIEHKENIYKIIYLEDLNIKSSEKLLIDLCENYHCQLYYSELTQKQREELLKKTNYSRKKINELAELIYKHYTYDQILNNITNLDTNNISHEQNELRRIMETEISRIYFILSIMPSGLPLSILNLYEQNFTEIIKQDKQDIIINENNWFSIKDGSYRKYIFEIMLEDKRKDCIMNALEIYSKLLFYYINKTREKICFPDSNIHYQFNSYYDKGFWKTLDPKKYQILFEKNYLEEYVYNEILEKNFVLEYHKDNIISLLKKNSKIIKDLIKKDPTPLEYLNQIILMLPSVYVNQKFSYFKKIIDKSILLCEEFDLKKSKQRLFMFLMSMKEKPDIKGEYYNLLGKEGEAEINFINGFKKKEIKFFLKIIKLYEEKENLYTRMPYVYYEIACCYFSSENFGKAIDNLSHSLTFALSEDIDDKFLRDIINIEFALKYEEKTHDPKNYEKYLKNVIKDGENINLINKAKNIIETLSRKQKYDIVMLNSNPFIKKENYSILYNSIWAPHNNQFYILLKIVNSIKKNLKIKSKVLNKDNLKEAFKGEGKILIIQSDDFNEEGEIILESSKGEGESLPNIKLKELLPEKLNYEMVILCFIKSGKLIRYFEGKTQNLITFDDINCEEIDYDELYKYNELSIDFLIHFIINYIEKNDYNKAFEPSLQTFNTNLKKTNIKLINGKNDNYITPTWSQINDQNNIFLEKNNILEKEKEGVVLAYPLPQNIDVNFRTKNYTDDILHLIRLILCEKKKIINIYCKNDTQDIKIDDSPKFSIRGIISFQIMKFLYRHQYFNGNIFYISSPNITKKAYESKEIIKSVLRTYKKGKEKNSLLNEINTAFIVINHSKKLLNNKKYPEKNFFVNLPDKFQYLIISKKEIEEAFNYEITVTKGNNNNNNNNKKSKKKHKKSRKKGKDNNINNNNFDTSSNLSLPNSPINEEKKKGLQIKEIYDENSKFTIFDFIESNQNENDDSISYDK